MINNAFSIEINVFLGRYFYQPKPEYYNPKISFNLPIGFSQIIYSKINSKILRQIYSYNPFPQTLILNSIVIHQSAPFSSNNHRRKHTELIKIKEKVSNRDSKMFTSQQKQQEKQDLQNIRIAFTNIYRLQQQPELQSLIQILHSLYSVYSQQLDRDIHQPLKINTLTFDSFRHQSEKIILKNQQLKQKILLIRAKLQQIHNLSLSSTSYQTYEERQNIDHVKLISNQIKTKISALKEKRYLAQQEAQTLQDGMPLRPVIKKRQKFSPSEVQIDEMKKGAEVMARSIMATRYEMQLVENFTHSSDDLRNRK